MKMFNDLGALVLWGLVLLMASTLNLPAVLAAKEKPTREKFKVLPDIFESDSFKFRARGVGVIDHLDLFLNGKPVSVVVEELSDDGKPNRADKRSNYCCRRITITCRSNL